MAIINRDKGNQSTAIAKIDTAIKRTILQRFFTLNEPLSIKEYRDLSRNYYQLNQNKNALSVLRVGLEYYPDSIDLRAELANTYMKLKSWPEAEKIWARIIEETGDRQVSEQDWLKLIRTLVQQDKYNKAKEAASKGIKNIPTSIILLREMANILERNKEWSGAARRWMEIINLTTNDPGVETFRGLAKAYLYTNKISLLKDVIKKGLETYPDNPELLEIQAEAMGREEKWHDSLKKWQEIRSSLSAIPNNSFQVLQVARFNESIVRRIINTKGYVNKITRHNNSKLRRRIAVVTAVTSGYDDLKPHEAVDDRIDYFAYSDKRLYGYGLYRVRLLPRQELDGPRSIRYIKTHPHELFPDYDTVVWIDANIMIVGDIMPMIEDFMNSGLAIGSGVHPHRKSIYEELEAAIERKKADPRQMRKQVNYYRRKRFIHDDLTENSLLMFNIGNPKLASAMELWWKHILRFSTRDQLSFNYCLQKKKTGWYPLTKPPYDIRNHKLFVTTPHHTDHYSLKVLSERIRKHSEKIR